MKRMFLGLACALAVSAGAAEQGPFFLDEERGADEVRVYGRNADPDAVRWAWVELAGADNVRPDRGLPYGFVIQPLDRRLLFTLRPADPRRGYSYALRSRSGPGDPQREPDAGAVYRLPWAHGVKHTVSQGYFGRATHSGLYALDFDMDEGSPVHAARAGTVIRVKDDGDRGGTLGSYARDGNVIEVLHDDATWAVYAHLQRGGARVQKGQRVKAGELIGLSGATGLASGPHLHLAVYRAGWQEPRSIPTVFYIGETVTASLEDGRTYYAWQAGGKPFKAELGEDLRDEDFRGLTRTASGGRLRLREERVDRRNLVWASNGTDQDLAIEVGLDQPTGVRASAALPYKAVVPARTEIYLFYVDFVGTQRSSYRLSVRYRPLR
jgi:murein DD-endopeptidase MepM/ murein hydrolase activator NlpD